jgi:hypothetical protein
LAGRRFAVFFAGRFLVVFFTARFLAGRFFAAFLVAFFFAGFEALEVGLAAGAGEGGAAGAGGGAAGAGCQEGGDGGLAAGVDGPPPSGGLGGQVDDIGSLPSRARSPRAIKRNQLVGQLIGNVVSRSRVTPPPYEQAYENDWPQPQLRSAFGLLIANPAPWRPSL